MSIIKLISGLLSIGRHIVYAIYSLNIFHCHTKQNTWIRHKF